MTPASPPPVCGTCGHTTALHDDTGCCEQWGSINDREFCQCTTPNPGNVVPSQWPQWLDE